MKIKMDKDLIRLQKEINLHVADIQRIQGLMRRLAMIKGKTVDELKRNKEKSRKTQAFLSETKKVQSKQNETTSGGMGGTSPEKSLAKTMQSGGGSTAGGSNNSVIIELLLFGP